MRKKWMTGCVVLLLCAFGVSGCGKGSQGQSGSSLESNFTSEKTDAGSEEDGLTAPEFSEATEAPETDGQTETPADSSADSPAETPLESPLESTDDSTYELKKKVTGPERNDYQDYKRQVKFMGLKTYKKLKSKMYSDQAEKGKVYLVLFLEIRNTGTEKLYFNPYQLQTKVDGKEVENTFLANDPEGYPTIFTNVEAGSGTAGFVTWQVPKNWKKLHLKYTGFEPNGEADMEMTFKRKDLKKPDPYYNTLYYQSGNR